MSTALNIVVVEDHKDLRETFTELLSNNGHHVLGLSCAEDLSDSLKINKIDLLITDLNLPEEDGISLAQRFRATHPHAGIVMVTARNTITDRVKGYGIGADIYLPKPIDPMELLAAVSSLARRLPAQKLTEQQNSSTLDLITVDTQAMIVSGINGKTKLTSSELNLITSLARAPSQRLDTWQLLQILGKGMDETNIASLKVRFVRLRKKLISIGATNDCITNIRSTGYQLCVSTEII
jgi:two-component system OmpR family response regulator